MCAGHGAGQSSHPARHIHAAHCAATGERRCARQLTHREQFSSHNLGGHCRLGHFFFIDPIT